MTSRLVRFSHQWSFSDWRRNSSSTCAGEFQDDAPAVEMLQYKKCQRNQLVCHLHKRRSHNDSRWCTRGATTTDFRWCTSTTTANFQAVHKRRNHSQLSLVHKKHNRKLLSNAQPLKHNQPLQGSNCSGVPNQAVQPQAGFAMLKLVNKQLFANGQPLQPGQNVQFINGRAVVVPAQPSAFATTFKTTDMLAMHGVVQLTWQTMVNTMVGLTISFCHSSLTCLLAILSAVARKQLYQQCIV